MCEFIEAPFPDGLSWFQAIQTFGIIAGFLVAAVSLWRNYAVTKVANSFVVTQHHRDIWKNVYSNSSLKRVFDPMADIRRVPITEEERTFVLMIFIHLGAVLKALKAGAIYPIEGMDRDYRDILSYPIPREVLRESWRFHDTLVREYLSKIKLGRNS